MKKLVVSESKEFSCAVIVGSDSKVEKIRMYDNSAGFTVGDIYIGKVIRIEKTLGCAFIDIGLDKPAILQLSDYPKSNPYSCQLMAGNTCVVQLFREPVGSKGGRLTGKITLKSPLSVLMVGEKGIHSSKELGSDEERQEYEKAADGINCDYAGVIVRSLAKMADSTALREDIERSIGLLESFRERASISSEPRLVWSADFFMGEFESIVKQDEFEIVTDSRRVYDSMASYLVRFDRSFVKRVSLKEDTLDVLTEFSVREEINGGFIHKKTVAGSGCEIVRNVTEAFTIYDINTSQSRHGDSEKDNFRHVNEMAVRAVIDDIYKYNISGIIMVDLVGAMNPEEKTKLMKKARDMARKKDKTISVHDITKLGVLEITRKKEQRSLMDIIGESCHVCSSTSGVISARYYLSWIHGIAGRHRKAGFRGVEVVSGTPSSSLVLANQAYFSELTEGGDFTISVTPDPTMGDWAFRVRPVGISSSSS